MSGQSRKIYESSAHSLSSVPTAGSRLSSVGTTKTGGVMENVGSATSEQFKTTPAFFKGIDTTSSAVVPPQSGPVPGTVKDGTEIPAVPFISLSNIQIQSSWTPSYTGNVENLSHSISIPDAETSSGTYRIFPDVDLIVSEGATTASPGVPGTTTTEAKIEGHAVELNTWVSPWNDPSSSIPHFNGGDYGRLRSPGFCKEHSDKMFIVTFTLTFGLMFSVGGKGASTIDLDFEIGIINNFNNDRDVYLTAYENAYGSMSKVPEVSERNY